MASRPWPPQLLLVLALLALDAPAAPGAFPTNPPLQRYAPTFEVELSNYAIAQSADSRVFVGNADGVLVFDGARWSLVRMPNNDLVRSLAADASGRIYVGGYDAFGYLERDATGLDVYHDLVPRFASLLAKDEKFADIWDVFVYPEGVFFNGVKHVFRYDPATGAVAVWRHDGRFGAMVRHHGEVVLQFRGEGLRRLQGADWEPLVGSAPLTDLIYQLIPTPEGGLLTTARDGRWREWREGRVRDYPMPVGMPSSTQFPQYVALEGGRVGLVSDDGKLYLLDLGARRVQQLSLDGSATLDITLANDGGLLVVSDEATYHVTWPSSWTSLGRAEGLTSSAFAVRRWGGRSFLTTSTDVFEVKRDATGAIALQSLAWTTVEAYDLLPLDPRRALLADSYAVRLIEDGVAREITRKTIYPRRFLRSRFHPERVYVGSEMGLAAVSDAGGSWRLSLDPGDEHELPISNLVETAADEIWCGTTRDGLLRYRLSPDGSRVLERTAFGPAEGLNFGNPPESRVALLEGIGLVATTSTGIFRFDGTRFAPLALDGLAALRTAEETLEFVEGHAGALWAFGARSVYHKPAAEPWRLEPTAALRRGVFNSAIREPDGSMLFVATGSVLRFDPAQPTPVPMATPVALRSVIYTDKDGPHRLPLDGSPVEVPEGGGSIAFQWSLVNLRVAAGANYRGRLLPNEASWDQFVPTTQYIYSNLRAAELEFDLTARDSFGRESAAPPFRFTVVPPWYARAWARVVWSGLALGIVALLALALARWRTRRLGDVTKRLEGMVTMRTRELESANRQLETIAHVDGLTGIPNRRRLDDYLKSVWENSTDRGRPISVLIVDVDHFKQFNDKHGHLAGDQLLRALATRLSRCLRRTEDLVARYGGEEFLAVLPGAELDVARDVAETMRARVEESTLGATISVGVATLTPVEGSRLEALLGDADAALYSAKHAGRNCVKVAAG